MSAPRTTVWRSITLLLTALLMGLTFAHTLEMPVKMNLDGPTWLALQHSLYPYFAIIGGPIEIAAIITSAWLAIRLRGQRSAFAQALVATLCLTVSFFGAWLMLVNPTNVQTAIWTAQAIPPDWTRWRAKWEYGHVVSFALHLVAFCLLLIPPEINSPRSKLRQPIEGAPSA
jgi:hypothetical protein